MRASARGWHVAARCTLSSIVRRTARRSSAWRICGHGRMRSANASSRTATRVRTSARENVSEVSSTTSSSLVHGASRSPAPTSSEAVRSPTWTSSATTPSISSSPSPPRSRASSGIRSNSPADTSSTRAVASGRATSRIRRFSSARELLVDVEQVAVAAGPAADGVVARAGFAAHRQRKRTATADRPPLRHRRSPRRTDPGQGRIAGAIIATMPVRVRFRCQFCDAVPDPETQRTLERGLRELVFGEYLDAPPGRWLVWHGRGPLGPTRYACADHRGDLVAYVREHYGTVAAHPWKMPPYATSRRTSDTERAIARGGLSSMPKWGLPS